MTPVLVYSRSEREARRLQQLVHHAGFESLVASQQPVIPSGGVSLVLASGTYDETEFRHLPPRIPVVTVTGRDSLSAREALEAGVAGCLPSGNLEQDLAWTLRGLLAVDPEGRAASRSTGEALCYTLENSPELLPLVVNQVRQRMESWPFPDPIELVRIMVALSESLDNALYHGNLELCSELRQGDGRAWRDESLRRRVAPPYCDRLIRFFATFGEQSARFIIRDEGPGFDPSSQLDCTKTQNLERCSGRGLLLMQMYMDDVDYNPAGNEVTLVKQRPQETP